MLNLLSYYILYSSLFYVHIYTYIREMQNVAGINNRPKSFKKDYGHEKLLINCIRRYKLQLNRLNFKSNTLLCMLGTLQ